MKQPLQKRQDWIRGRREKRKQARAARLRRQVFRYLMLTSLIALGVCGFLYLPWALGSINSDVSIHGNKVASEQQVRDSLKSAAGQRLYKLDPAELERRICALPIVKYAFVRRCAFPRPGLRVEVLEEFPWASYCSDPDSPPQAVIAQSGRLIPIAEFPGVIQPPLRICGTADLKLNETQIAQWDGWVRLISEQLGKPVEVVDMRQPTQIVVNCGDVCMRVGQADSSLTRRIGRLSSVLPVIATLKDKLKYIDLSLDSNIPLRVDKTGSTPAQGDALLREAVRADAPTL